MATLAPLQQLTTSQAAPLSRYRSARKVQQTQPAPDIQHASPASPLSTASAEQQDGAIQRSRSRYRANRPMQTPPSQQSIPLSHKTRIEGYTTAPYDTTGSTDLANSNFGTRNVKNLEPNSQKIAQQKFFSALVHDAGVETSTANDAPRQRPRRKEETKARQPAAPNDGHQSARQAATLPYVDAPVKQSRQVVTTESRKRSQSTKKPMDYVNASPEQIAALEAERMRKLRAKIRADKEKAIADEELRKQEKEEEDARKVREAREEEERIKQANAERKQQAREEEQRTKQANAERKKREQEEKDQQRQLEKGKRERAQEERIQRHRKGSLAALEGMWPRPWTSNGQLESPPPVPLIGKDKLGFLRRRSIDGKKTLETTVPTLPQLGGAPAVDAPLSGTSMGDRYVLVECDKSSIMLAVNSSTTSVDLIRSASTFLTENINPTASVLMENFGKVGLQRPLRSYELIRDVLNSWDHDRQNSLIIVPSTTGGPVEELETSGMPNVEPPEVSCYMIYSQKPGKWDKKWLILRSDGQVVSAKSETSHTNEMTNVCHMTDFDIYTPTPKQLAKVIKPPKKHCFAIKSQQKSHLFESTENFVHFFSTADKTVADEWYKAIQRWRSWYLVHVMGEGNKGPNMLGGNLATKPSVYQLGSFKPLLDLDIFDMGPSLSSEPNFDHPEPLIGHARNNINVNGLPSSVPEHIRLGPSLSRSNSTNRRTGRPSLDPGSGTTADEATFSPTGLLGRTYSQRQKNQRDRDAASKGPFTAGPSLLSDIQKRDILPALNFRLDEYDDGVASLLPKQSLDLSRRASQRHGTKPLGRGFQTDGTRPLIDSATTPERSMTTGPGRSVSNAHKNADGSPFSADGLLAGQLDNSKGLMVGKGVMAGTDARNGPMLSMNESSMYAPGSLLRKVEMERPHEGPIIDRSKEGNVVKVGTGEGL